MFHGIADQRYEEGGAFTSGDRTRLGVSEVLGLLVTFGRAESGGEVGSGALVTWTASGGPEPLQTISLPRRAGWYPRRCTPVMWWQATPAELQRGRTWLMS